ncbi:MAG: hypothetical protein LBO79_04460 [Zoogloeaceae bacterium]|jgi:hypothetical protein|nr:hypothetical protein [Zoogloeaceae bacterium]
MVLPLAIIRNGGKRWLPLAGLALACLARAQELPPGTPEPIRRDLTTIQHYSNEVGKRTGNAARQAGSSVPADASGGGATETASSRFTPIAIVPPKTSITPDAPNRFIDTVERDPFEVSPQLRAGGRNRRIGQMESVTISRALRLRALARGPSGGVAKIQLGRGEIITVYDGDDLDVDGIRYTVRVERDGLVLRGSGAPQYRMLVRP